VANVAAVEDSIRALSGAVSPGAARNIAAIAPELIDAVRRGDPEAVLEFQRIMASGNAQPRGLGFVGSDSTDVIPFGTRGPGVMAGNELIPAPQRGMTVPPSGDFPPPPRGGIFDLEGPPPRRGLPDNSSNMRTVDDPNYPPKKGGGGRTAAGAAATGAAGATGAWWVANQPEAIKKAGGSDTKSRGTTADLAAESRPVPSVTTKEPAPIKPNYREQALALQKELNAKRRAAGGEIPEAQKMRAEIQRLFDLADKETNAAARRGQAPKPTGANDYLGQARQILAALNAGTIPPNQRAQAQRRMKQLYDMANRQDNARTTAYPRR
jgi:hypothetical protein